MKTAVMFSGQGTQYPGMMRDIVEEYAGARELFDMASELMGRDMFALTMNSSQEDLDQTKNTQPCLLTCELAALRAVRENGLQYDAALGFSLGEWTALAASGAAEERDVLRVIDLRADAMQRAVPPGEGGMAAILGKDVGFVLQLCQMVGDIAPANYNCPGNITVAGTAAAVERFMEEAARQGITAVRVAISIPSHCTLMSPAADELVPAIERLRLFVPRTELVMNATGKPAIDRTEIKQNLIRQLMQPVLFQQSIEYLLENGYEAFIEIGPGKSLSGMVKRTAKQSGKRVKIMQICDLSSMRTVCEECRGFSDK